MKHDTYILNALSKKNVCKKWEHYAINRIYHRLNDPDIEFVCQQFVRKEDGKIYLIDLFFPQFNIYLEINERHHKQDLDNKRELEIAKVTSLQEKRIYVTDTTPLVDFNSEIDKFVQLIRDEKCKLEKENTFIKWGSSRRHTSAPHIEAGYIEIGDKAVFKTHKDALECFGYEKGLHQRAEWNIEPKIVESIGLSGKCMVWFPKLYKNKGWENSLSADRKTIIEKSINPRKKPPPDCDYRIVFAHSSDALTPNLYRFIGVFKPLAESKYTINDQEHRFTRHCIKVNLPKK